MSYQLSAGTIYELEQKLAQLKAENTWKERPELPKIKQVMKTRRRVFEDMMVSTY